MTDKQASPSAQRVAITRYAHIVYDGEPKIHEDHPSIKLVDPDFVDNLEMYKPNDKMPRGLANLRLFLPYRARAVEDNLYKSYQAGVRQYLIMGAGLDSYSLRQNPEMPDLQIFEIDHPASQTFKKKRIAANGWNLPKNLEFVPCDFELTSVTEALKTSNFDPEKPCYIAWAGVIMYLDRASGEAALKEMGALSAPGSTIIFDYNIPEDELDAETLKTVTFIKELAKNSAEPFKTEHAHGQIETMLSAAGYTDIQFSGFDEPARTLSSNREDGLELPKLNSVVLATK